MITTSFWAVFEIKFMYLQVLSYFSSRFFSCILGTVIHIFTYKHPCCPHDLLDSSSFLHFDIFTPAPHLLILTKKMTFRGFLCGLLGACNPIRYKLTVFTVNALCSLVIIVATNFNIFVLTRQLQESHVSSEASWIYAKFYAYMRRKLKTLKILGCPCIWVNLETFGMLKLDLK